MSQAHKNIARDIQLLTCTKNETIYEQGDYGDSFFYILSGIVDVFIKKKDLDDADKLNKHELEKEVIRVHFETFSILSFYCWNL